MRGLVFLGERELAIRDFPDPSPGPREVIVAMKASGMCGSDLKHYIYGSWTFGSVGQAECAQFIVDRQLSLKRLLTHRFRLDEAHDAYRLFETQTTGKGVFVFD